MSANLKRTWREIGGMLALASAALLSVAAVNQSVASRLDRDARQWNDQIKQQSEFAPADIKEATPVVSPAAGVFHGHKDASGQELLAVGVVVQPDTQLGVVEPIDSTPLPITAGVAGKIKQILVQEGEMVTQGQALLKIETAASAE